MKFFVCFLLLSSFCLNGFQYFKSNEVILVGEVTPTSFQDEEKESDYVRGYHAALDQIYDDKNLVSSLLNTSEICPAPYKVEIPE